MTAYLLDTSICVFFLRDRYGVAQKIKQLNQNQCFISEVTVAELMFGAYRSANVEKNLALVRHFVSSVQVLPFSRSISFYAEEKARLCSAGTPVDDFDLLIGSAAVSSGLVMVTDNVKHFKNIQNIQIENWVDRDS